MAATYVPSAAWNAAKFFVRGMLLGDLSNDIKYLILDNALKHVWMAAPWRWTVGMLPNISLSTATDYDITSTPGDFLKISRCYWSDANCVEPMEVVDILPPTPIVSGKPMIAAWIPGTPNKIRIYPPMGNLGGTSLTLVSYYKKQAPAITAGNFGSAGAWVIDDEYFPVIFAFVLYYAMLACHDQRAGAAEWDEQIRAYKYSGQLATANAMIEDMRRRENLPLEWNHQPDRKADRR
jgi:hypothetical protein